MNSRERRPYRAQNAADAAPTKSVKRHIKFGSRARSIGRAIALLALMLPVRPLLIQAEEAPVKAEVFSLWDGHSPVGDGTFQNEDAQITLFRAAHPNGACFV